MVFAFFINPIGASAINPGTQNLGPIHPHHPSSRGAFTLTSVASSTGPALPNWILPENPVTVSGFQRPQVNSVRDHRDGTSSSRRESSTGIDLRDSLPAGANTRKKANIKLTITQATRLLDAEVHESREEKNYRIRPDLGWPLPRPGFKPKRGQGQSHWAREIWDGSD